MNNKKLLGYILAVLAIFFWGITFVCTKSLLNYFSALEILFIRFLAAYVGLWLMRPKWEKIAAKDNLLFALAGLTGVVIYQFSENIAINFTTASNVSVIVSTCPLFTAIISQIFLKEKHINLWFIIGFVFCIFGVSLVSLNGRTDLSINPKGDLLALLSSISWGFYSMVVSLLNKKGYDSICATRRIFFFAVILMIPLVLAGVGVNGAVQNKGLIADDGLAESVIVNLSGAVNKLRFSKPLNCIYLLFLGLIASGFCFAAWNKACLELGTVKITKGLYLIPVVTIIFAFFILGEKITWMGALGTIITITGLFISEIKRKTSEQAGTAGTPKTADTAETTGAVGAIKTFTE